MSETHGRPGPADVGVMTQLDPGDRITSFVTRLWRPEDVPRCTLCPTCRARPVPPLELSMCIVGIRGFIGDDEARLHRLDESAGDSQGAFQDSGPTFG
jgi:hypothetical protein